MLERPLFEDSLQLLLLFGEVLGVLPADFGRQPFSDPSVPQCF
jgi:hypothetical protein